MINSTVIEVSILLLGCLGLWFGSGIIIKYAMEIIKKFHISGEFIGLTLLSIGTTLPEMATHIIASIDILKDPQHMITLSGIALGTNFGSNIIQITAILGLIGLLITVKTDKKIQNFDYPIMLGAIFLVFLISLDGRISRIEGVFLALLYLIYLGYLIKKEKIRKKIADNNKHLSHLFLYVFFIAIGIAVLIYSADLVIDNAVLLSDHLKISGTFIGSLIIGVSTALPELAVVLRGIMKKATAISLGTLVGSNITNPLWGVGIGAIISGYHVSKVINFFDLPFWFFSSLLIWIFFFKGKKLFKWEAIACIMIYLLYVGLKIMFFTKSA
ncbi:MAG: hypothetical protein KKH52_03935 [Nanoarchaeota archaeon]|nr:hypothetical protein [Nanoarchaeota archaeon]MBU1622954.1 hypothetical protein [Nanoarchaeota archaeon]MBU1974519.1 hypothetical protein [Nanoarchaeota archaeon]